ncbi:hypothetical protein CEXT_537341 [Caerostris extrusa]|uniref:Uncharacterized protein n=1 Tax=Caerostris extrusa TaxID=172846 RepID=A0AAV4RS87_CAEEX|nr:hypothetical protein CEXT_537341 [Caerostris extrusa]
MKSQSPKPPQAHADLPHDILQLLPGERKKISIREFKQVDILIRRRPTYEIQHVTLPHCQTMAETAPKRPQAYADLPHVVSAASSRLKDGVRRNRVENPIRVKGITTPHQHYRDYYAPSKFQGLIHHIRTKTTTRHQHCRTIASHQHYRDYYEKDISPTETSTPRQ